VENDGLHVMKSAGTREATSCLTALSQELTNFAYQIEVTIPKGNGGGLFFIDKKVSEAYTLDISPESNTYSFTSLKPNSKLENLKQDTYGAWQHSNILTMIVVDTNVYLYINGQSVATWSGSGRVLTMYWIGALGSSTQKLGVDVVFKDAKVWKL